ncbi:MAG: hypothetical protein ABSH53_01840 [Holophaga sp.]
MDGPHLARRSACPFPSPSAAHAEPKPKPPEPALLDLPPLPSEAKVRQSITLGGKTLAYTCSVQALPVRDEKGRKVAEVVCTA